MSADTAQTYLYEASENAKIACTVLGAAIESRKSVKPPAQTRQRKNTRKPKAVLPP
ncbi:MAG: hypothetical protein R2874_14940 [Desulfobacterales bacterium]